MGNSINEIKPSGILDWEARSTRFLLANYGGGDLEKAI